MGAKLNPGAYDCHAVALPDEPHFTLLARDPNASLLVLDWADERAAAIERGDRPASDIAMVAEARNCARAMEAWRDINWPARKAEQCPPAITIEAVHDHPWMLLTGPSDDYSRLMIEQDGE